MEKKRLCNTICFLDFLEDNFDFFFHIQIMSAQYGQFFGRFFEVEKEIKIVSEILPPEINVSFAYVL